MIRDRLTKKAYPIQLPVGSGELFTGHIDVLRRVEFIFDDETLGKTFTEMPVPEAYRERVEAARHEVIEAAVEHDEELLEKYLGGAELSFDEIQRAIRKATTSGSIVPVLCGASFKNKGVQALLDAVIDYLPSPMDIPPIKGHLPLHDDTHVERCASDSEPFSALAFKIATDPYVGRLTFFRVYSGALKSGSYVYNSTKDKRERVGRLLQMHANKRDEIEEVLAGDIAAAIGLKETRTGDTLSDEDKTIILEAMRFPNPVIDVAIEPKTKADRRCCAAPRSRTRACRRCSTRSSTTCRARRTFRRSRATSRCTTTPTSSAAPRTTSRSARSRSRSPPTRTSAG